MSASVPRSELGPMTSPAVMEVDPATFDRLRAEHGATTEPEPAATTESEPPAEDPQPGSTPELVPPPSDVDNDKRNWL